MKPSRIKAIIKQGEGISIEFKECKKDISQNVYDTVCAFLNRNGGELLLGINDNGKITGIDVNYIEQIKKNFVNAVNNPQKISPAFYLTIEEIEISGKSILYIYVPESSQVHRCNGKIFDRNEDGDFNITENTNLVAALYLRKQTTYSENRVYPYVTMKDLRSDLIAQVRKWATIQNARHPWAKMSDINLIKSSQMYLKDFQSGKKGFTLAAVLIFGKDDVILSVLPHFRTDAIIRKVDVDRYDDRDDIRTNLLDSHDRLMAFVAKHLPDKFFMENGRRISLRDNIFREIIVNLLIHREFLNAFPAKLVIEKDRIFTENSNRPHGYGLIDPTNFSPFPKNPVIARFFKQIAWSEELGSGVRKLAKYGKIYFGAQPQFFEKDVFKMIVATPQATQETVEKTVETAVEKTTQKLPRNYPETTQKIFDLIRQNPRVTRNELAKTIGLTQEGIKYHLRSMQKKNLIHRIGPDRGGYWKIIKI